MRKQKIEEEEDVEDTEEEVDNADAVPTEEVSVINREAKAEAGIIKIKFHVSS
jgi:hypothetical protein